MLVAPPWWCDAPPVTGEPPPFPAVPSAGWTTDAAAAWGAGLLEGRAVRLRATTEEDLPVLEEWWLDPAVAVLQSDVVRPGPPGTIADRFRSWSANTGEDLGLSVEEQATGELAGHVALFGAHARRRSATLGVLMGPAHRRRGLGRDAVELSLRYAFSELNLHRVQLQVWAFNERALRTYRDCGFVEEGRRREVVFHGGSWHDEVGMAVLEHEWRARRQPTL